MKRERNGDSHDRVLDSPERAARTTGDSADVWSRRQMSIASRQKCDRPTPLVLSQIIERFGVRSQPATNLSGFLLSGCRATAHRSGGQTGPVEIDIRALGFSEIQFTAADVFKVGTTCEIVLASIGSGLQRWYCQVVRAEPCAGSIHHIVARFFRRGGEGADVSAISD
jgi:hypothetical protein